MNREGLRKCKVRGDIAYFHRWTEYKNVINPSPMIGGPSGGQIQYPLAIVESEDGNILMVNPGSIQFVD
jgi:hypothetical protein